MGGYESTYRRSLDDPEGFWLEAAQAIDWVTPPTRALDPSRAPFYRWFPDGVLNTCWNAVDRHVAGGRGDQVAIVHDSPVTGAVRRYTYRQLLSEVSRFAGVLTGLGVTKGDRVVIYMPMIHEAVVGMLACARIGAIHSVVFGGFAPHELAVRIDDAKPKVVLSASAGIEGAKLLPYLPMLDRALELARHQPERCVIVQRPAYPDDLRHGRDLDWYRALRDAEPVDCVPVEATHPLYVLYTSGTTGTPKGVVRDNGGHAVALRWSMRNVYDVDPGDVFWAASDVGWVVGHSYIAYAPLLSGCTTVIYEGKPVGTPDAGAFWRVASQHKVRTLFTAPTAIRAIRRDDPEGKLLAGYDLSELRYLFLAGERCDPDTHRWASALLDRPVIDHWWQTESGWPMVANCAGIELLPIRSGSPTKPVPGYDVAVLDEEGRPVGPGVEGLVAVRLPLPPGTLTTIWGDDERYVNGYLTRLPGWYTTGDAGHVDEDGYLSVMGRVDDVINVAGHRLSTGLMEQVVAAHIDVAECAVIGIHDDLKGQVPVGLVVLKAGVERDPTQLSAELVRLVRTDIGALASFKTAYVVERLPKTRSGKILRATMRAIADGRPYTVPSTIEDATTLDEIAAVLGR